MMPRGFFYVLRKSDQHLDFDLELAKSQSNENPVYYIQYAHARICSVLAQWGGDTAELVDAKTGVLNGKHELALMNLLNDYSGTVENAARELSPHLIAYYLKDLAGEFHSYYNAEQFLVPDNNLRLARLALITAIRQVLRTVDAAWRRRPGKNVGFITFMSRDYKKPDRSSSRKEGSPLFTGVLIGLIVGLAVAIGVALYITSPQALRSAEINSLRKPPRQWQIMAAPHKKTAPTDVAGKDGKPSDKPGLISILSCLAARCRFEAGKSSRSPSRKAPQRIVFSFRSGLFRRQPKLTT